MLEIFLDNQKKLVMKKNSRLVVVREEVELIFSWND